MQAHTLTTALAATTVIAVLAGCGGETDTDDLDPSSAPTDATVERFCETMEDPSAMEVQPGEHVSAWLRKLVRIGTPADLTAEERRGFEVYVTMYHEHDGENSDGWSWSELVSGKDLEAAQAFYSGYTYDHCDIYGEDE